MHKFLLALCVIALLGACAQKNEPPNMMACAATGAFQGATEGGTLATLWMGVAVGFFTCQQAQNHWKGRRGYDPSADAS